jgi:hypothetical protein
VAALLLARRAHLAGRVVQLPLVKAAAVEIVAVNPGQHARMVYAGIDPRRKWRQVGPRVKLGHYHRPVHVAFDEVDQHLGADARRELGAPVGAGQRLGYAYPGAGGVIAGRVTLLIGLVRNTPGLGPCPRCHANCIFT